VLLVFAAGIQLFVLAGHTDRDFAWTIQPPLTAAVLGAFYWAALAMLLVAAARPSWPTVRAGMPAVLAGTILILAATLLHLGIFHLHAPHAETIAFAWIWIVVYVAVPPLIAVVWVLQARVAGPDPPRQTPLPRWLRAATAAEGLALLAMGVALFVAPHPVDSAWPWTMTPLAGQALGASLVAIGALLVGTAAQDEWAWSIPAFSAELAFGVLAGIAVVRYPSEPDWSSPAAWVFLVFVGLALGLGGYRCLAAPRNRSGPA